MANSAAILQKLARNAKMLGLTVNSQVKQLSLLKTDRTI